MDPIHGIDLLSYPEKFDIALKLGNIREKYNKYLSGLNIPDAFDLKYNQPDAYMLPSFLPDRNTPVHVTSYIQVVLLNKLWLKLSPRDIVSNNKTSPWKHKVDDAWFEFIKISYQNLTKCLPNNEQQISSQQYENTMQALKNHTIVQEAFFLYKTSRTILAKHRSLSKTCMEWLNHPYPKPAISPIKFELPNADFILQMGWDIGLITFNGQHYLLDRDLFLLLMNKLSELACALMYCVFQNILFRGKGGEKLKQFLLILTKPMIKWFLTHGDINQEIYDLPKSIEAIGVGIIIEKEDLRRGWKNDIFIKNTIESLMDSRFIPRTNIENNELYRFFSELTTPEVSELIGGVKLVGHPDIDFQAGVKKLFDRTHLDINIDQAMIEETQGAFVHEFTQNYYQRHRTWPPLIIPDNDSRYSKLKAFIQINKSPLSEEVNIGLELTWRDWSRIDIDKCIELDYWESPLEFLKDTALSPDRSATLKYCIAHKLHPNETYQSVQKGIREKKRYTIKDSNRLIIQFLLSPIIYERSLQYRQNWASNPNWEDVLYESNLYMVIKLTAKEREEKWIGRYFGASPSCERDRRIQIEGELAKFMHSYIPEQMLTATDLEFNQKLIKFRNYRRLYPNHHVVQLCFDFQAWNNYMRAQFIDHGIGEKLNGIFNTYAYSRVMKFYQNALLYAESPSDLFAWMGQQGGIEGLNQSTWTLATLMGLKIALSKVGFKFEVSVKGDDCRAAIMIPIEECPLTQLHQEVDRIKEALADYCRLTGMSLKPEETFQSLCLIASSKQYQLDDILLPCGLKQAIKIAHHSNAAFPTSQTIVSDIMSSCHSACYSTPFLINTWSMGVLIGLWRLGLDYALFNKLSVWEIIGLCLWPQILGGPGMLPLEVFIVRGENDMLSITLDLYHFVMCKFEKSHPLTMILWRILRVPDAKKLSYRLLLSDPYSLNREHPLSPSQFLKQTVITKIKEITRNPLIRKLLSADYEHAERVLIRILFSIRPSHLKVIVGIYENSPFSVLGKVIERIDNANSLFILLGSRKGLIQTRRGLRILYKAHRIHQEQIQWWVKVLTHDPSLRFSSEFYSMSYDTFINQCPTLSAQTARCDSWKLPIIGITYPSLSRQFHLINADHPMNYVFTLLIKPHCGYYVIQSTKSITPQSDHDHPYFAAPDNPSPWVGGKTDTKARLPGAPKLHKSVALPKIQNLLEIYARIELICPDLCTVIKWLVRLTVYLTDEEFLLLLPEISGGSIAHRLVILAYSLLTTPNFRHNLLQFVLHNYDHMKFTHSALSRDWSLNFLAIMIFHKFILTHDWMFNPNPEKPKSQYFMLIHQAPYDITQPVHFNPCKGCLDDLTDVDLTVVLEDLPDLDLSENALIVLPPGDQVEIHNALSVLKDQRQLHLMNLLNQNPRGSLPYMYQAHTALISKLLVDAKHHNEELSHTAPGGFISEALIQSFGKPFNPLPLKFLTWLDPKIVCENLIEFGQIELLMMYTRDELAELTNLIHYPLGVQNNLLPILKLYEKSGSLPNLTLEIREYTLVNRIPLPLSGLNLTTATNISHWIFTIGRLIIARESNQKKTKILTVVTTHSGKIPDMLIHLHEKYSGLMSSLIGFKWQRYYPYEKGLFWSRFRNQGNPCEVFCHAHLDNDGEGGTRFYQWLMQDLDTDLSENHQQWLVVALMLPTMIQFNIRTTHQLEAAYQNPNPVPLFTRALCNSQIYDDYPNAFESINHFLGFNVQSFLLNSCGHMNDDPMVDWIPIIDHIDNYLSQPDQYPQLIVTKLMNRMRTKIERQFHIKINHMDEEAAMLEVATDPYSDSNLYADLQEKLQNPPQNILTHHFQANLRQTIYPSSIMVTDLDRLTLNESEIPPWNEIHSNWVNWNQHFRIKGYSGTAASKLFMILNSAGLLHQRIPNASFLCLADGRGGFSTLLAKLYPQSIVFFNTLLDVDSTVGGIPADWVAQIGESTRLNCLLSEDGDLCRDEERSSIIHIIRNHMIQQKMTLTTFDAEFYGEENITDYLHMIDNVTQIISATSGPDSVIILKLFYYPRILSSKGFLYLIDTCKQYRLVKPFSSRETNREFYLVINGITYPYTQFPNKLHHRRKTRLLVSLRNLLRDWNVNDQRRLNFLLTHINGFMNSRHPKLINVLQIENSLFIQPFCLRNKSLWETNQVLPLLEMTLGQVKVNIASRSRHILTRGKRQVGVGGVSVVINWTRQFLRLQGCISILKPLNGPLITTVNTFEEGILNIHRPEIQTSAELYYQESSKLLVDSDYWSNCNEHQFCLTSRGSYLPWANEEIHVDLIHEFGVGCDVALRMLTIGLIYLYLQLPYDILDSFIQG